MALLANKHQNIKPFNVNDLRGGINIYSPADMLADNEARNLENFEFNPNTDQLVTRGGLSAPLFSFQYDIKSVYYDYEMNIYLVFLANKNIYKYVINEQPELLGSLLGSNRPVCCKFGNNVYIASGEKLQQYDYASLTTIEDSPLCDDVFERFGRLAVTKGGTDSVLYSGIGDVTLWTDDPNDDSDGWETQIGYKDGGDIIGVFPLATDIIVFKSNGKIFQLAGEPPDQTVFEIGKNSDFVYRFGADNLGSELIYMSKQGLRSLSTSQEYGNFQNREFGAKVNGELAKFVYRPVIWNLPRKKQLLIRPDETGTKVLAYHYLIGAFTLLNFPYVVADITESPTEVILAMGNSLYYWSQNYNTDNGTPITAKIKSKQIKSIQPILVKRLSTSINSSVGGSATIVIDGISIPITWTNALQTSDMRFQIRSNVIDVEFTTTNKITFNHILMETVVL